MTENLRFDYVPYMRVHVKYVRACERGCCGCCVIMLITCNSKHRINLRNACWRSSTLLHSDINCNRVKRRVVQFIAYHFLQNHPICVSVTILCNLTQSN